MVRPLQKQPLNAPPLKPRRAYNERAGLLRDQRDHVLCATDVNSLLLTLCKPLRHIRHQCHQCPRYPRHLCRRRPLRPRLTPRRVRMRHVPMPRDDRNAQPSGADRGCGHRRPRRRLCLCRRVCSRLGPVPWTLCSEIFPMRVRSRATSVTTATNWLANTLLGKAFPYCRSLLRLASSPLSASAVSP